MPRPSIHSCVNSDDIDAGKCAQPRPYWVLASNSNSLALYHFKIPPPPPLFSQNCSVQCSGVSEFQDLNIECSWVQSNEHNMETED